MTSSSGLRPPAASTYETNVRRPLRAGPERAREALPFDALLRASLSRRGPAIGHRPTGGAPLAAPAARPAPSVSQPIRASSQELANAGATRGAEGSEGEERAGHPRLGRRGATADDASDVIDPDGAARGAAMLAPPWWLEASGATGAMGASDPASPAGRARLSLEELVPALVRKIAWAGDARTGTVQMQLGAGDFAGATVTVHADHGRLRVEVATSAVVDAAALRLRLERRLRAAGLDVETEG